MAIYRQQRRLNPRVLLGIVGIAALVIIVIGILVVLVTRPAVPVDPVANAKAKALEVAQGLDILTVEYPQAAQGVELAGIRGTLNRTKITFEAAKADLMKLDSVAVTQIATDFATLEEKINAKAPADEVVALADKLKSALLALSK